MKPTGIKPSESPNVGIVSPIMALPNKPSLQNVKVQEVTLNISKEKDQIQVNPDQIDDDETDKVKPIKPINMDQFSNGITRQLNGNFFLIK